MFTLAVSIATGVVFGLAPAIQASRPDLVVELKEKTSAPTGSNRLFSMRNVLVSAQVALSLVALVGAGLFLRSLQHAQQISPGFDSEHLAVLSFDLGAQGYTEERGRQFQQRVLERAASVPGVQAASVASTVPLFAGGFARTVFLEGQDASDRRAGRLVQISVVGSRYLETAGIPLLRGRTLSETDQPNTPLAVVVNETMAKTVLARAGRDRQALQVLRPGRLQSGRRHREGQQVQLHRRGSDAVHLSGDDAGVSAATVAVREGAAAVGGARHGARGSAAARSQPAADRTCSRCRRSSIRRCGRRGWPRGSSPCSPGCRSCSPSSASTA